MFRQATCLIALVWLSAMAVGAASAAESGLVGWWKLDGDALDSSGAGNHGTLQGDPQPVAGKIGDALDFDGNDNVNVSGAQLPANAFTIMLWFNPASALGSSSTRQDLLYWQVGNGRPHVTFNRSGTGEIGLWPTVGGDFEGPLTTTRSWAGGTWYHIAATFDGANFKIYVNGNLENTVNHPGTHDPASDLLIGSRTSQRNYFQGIIDDVRLYNRALTEKEVQQVMIGVPPGAASKPNPENEATDVSRDVVVNWTPGDFAPTVNGHRVYFSASFNDVNDGVGGTTVNDSSYDPGRLDFGVTYYWRVDEVNAPPDSTVFPGEVWNFTTEPVGYPIDSANITATASSAGGADFGPEKTIDGSGLDADDLHSTNAVDMWLSNNEPLGAWLQFEFDKVYKLHEMWVWNSNQVLEAFFGFGMKNVTVEYSANGADWTALAGVPEFARAPGTAGYAHNTTVDFDGAAAKYVKLTSVSNWGGILPQFGLSEVRIFSIPVSAREPSPDIGSVDVNPAVSLTWRAGREAAIHNVFVSIDEQAVIEGSAQVVRVTDESYGSALDLGSTYYWRVDEVNEAQTPASWQGDVWRFSTSEYLVVDDFESYNDIDPPDPESNRIFESWSDGYNVPTNGALVGNDPANPSYAETVTIHGGAQAMPVFYGNTGGATYSEAQLTFAPGQDWTKHGIETLVLYFHGSAGNTGQMYVKVNGTKLPYPGDTTAIAKPRWTQWNIDLASLGVTLTNISTLAIGVDGNGAAGTLYIDDIVLYRLAPEVVVPSEEIWIEAEAATTITAPMMIYDDPLASGGKYIGTTDDVGDSSDSPPLNGIATYKFTVQGGIYKISCRIIIPSGDSFWVRIPGAGNLTPGEDPDNPGTGWVRWSDPPNSAGWYWYDVFSGDHDAQTANWTLPAGSYTLEIARREDGALMDTIVISRID